MWFEHAFQNEKIQHMFRGELSLNNVCFEDFVFYNMRTVDITFRSRNIPSVVPEKWLKKECNSLLIKLMFTEVNLLELSCTKMGFICTPEFHWDENVISLLICNEANVFKLRANYMFINDITPVTDSRYSMP